MDSLQRTFSELLKCLAEEHDREVGNLKAHIGKLEATICGGNSEIGSSHLRANDFQCDSDAHSYDSELVKGTSYPSIPCERSSLDRDTVRSLSYELDNDERSDYPEGKDNMQDVDNGDDQSSSFDIGVDPRKANSFSSTLEPKFQLWESWTVEVARDSSLEQETDVSRAFTTLRVSLHSVMSSTPGDRTFTLQPFSPFSMFWNLTGFSFLAFDVFYVPLLLLEPPDVYFLTVLTWVITIYWTLDIFLTFRKAYYHDGVLVTNARQIAKNYAKSWLSVDFLIITLDWAVTVLKIVGYDGSMGNSVRLLRIVRAVRLLRLAKLKQLLSEFQSYVGSSMVSIQLTIVRLVLTTFVINHFLACAWYAVGIFSEEKDGQSWLAQKGVFAKSLNRRYTLCLHWSLVQFGVGSTDIVAQTGYEETYSILVLFFALFMVSILVSNITNSVSHFMNLKAEEEAQFTDLRRFCRMNSVPKSLSGRLRHFLEYKFHGKQTHLGIQDVVLFKLLSQPLMKELKQQIYLRFFLAHTIFGQIYNQHGPVVSTLCTVLEELALAPGDVLFPKGKAAQKSFFAKTGELSYIRRSGDVQSCDDCWISFNVLWVNNWFTRGEMEALVNSELLGLDRDDFASAAQELPRSLRFICRVAKQLVQNLNLMPSIDLSDLEDSSMRMQHTWSVPLDRKARLESMANQDLPIIRRIVGHIRNIF